MFLFVVTDVVGLGLFLAASLMALWLPEVEGLLGVEGLLVVEGLLGVEGLLVVEGLLGVEGLLVVEGLRVVVLFFSLFLSEFRLIPATSSHAPLYHVSLTYISTSFWKSIVCLKRRVHRSGVVYL